MFSTRTAHDLTPNRLAEAIEARRRSGQPILDLTATNPTQSGFAYPPDLFCMLASPNALTYAPAPFGMMPAREAVARDYARRGFDVSPARVILTASTSEAYGLLFKLLADAGDEVLVPRPSYPLFEHLAQLELVCAVPYDLDIEAAWRIDWDSIERGLSARTRAVLVVSPNNPTGSYVKADEMNRMAELCSARNLAIVADEVFADYEIEPGARRASASVVERDDVLAFSLGGLSKSVGLPQAKLAWMAAAGPGAAVAAALRRLELVCDTYLSVSTPVQCAAQDLLTSGADVRRQIAGRIVANERYLRDRAASVPSIGVLPVEGGWSAVVQVPAVEAEETLVLDLLEHDGVLTHPGYFFDFAREAFLVVSLITPVERFAAGVDRIMRHFDCKVGRP